MTQMSGPPPQGWSDSTDEGTLPAPDDITCPMECTLCCEPGDCEDCLDCLYWPDVVEEPPGVMWPREGPTSPLMGDELASARLALGQGVGRRIGLAVRRFRRSQRVTQRRLADELGWSRSAMGRLEADATGTPLGRVEEVLDLVGYRLALIPTDNRPDADLGEESDETWSVTDLLPKDGRGRRPPPFGLVRWHSPIDRRLDGPSRGHENAWTWHRPRPTPPVTPPG